MRPRRLCIFTLTLCLAHLVTAQPVVFLDANLKTAVETALGVSNPTVADMQGLIELEAEESGIADLTGLETATNLETLILSKNEIVDLSPLAELTSLLVLNLSSNQIEDVSFLFELVNLQILLLEDNLLSNHFPTYGLAELVNLEILNLSSNQLNNIFAVAGLPNLIEFYVYDNPLNYDSFYTYIPQLQANGTTVFSDPAPLVMLPDVSTYPPMNVGETSATLRAGEVSSGGEDTERRFVYWIAGYRSLTERTTDWVPVTLSVFSETVEGLLPGTDYRYIAELRNSVGVALGDPRSFTTLGTPTVPVLVLYVDDDAPYDPSPGDLYVSDPAENGSKDHPYDSIQEAVDAATGIHVTIQVLTGRYYETVTIQGKSLHLNGIHQEGSLPTAFPVIDASGLGTVLTCIQADGADCVISGFSLTGGQGALGGAVSCLNSSPLFDHCLFVGNRFSIPTGGTVYLQNSHSAFFNCTFVDNVIPEGGATVSLWDSQAVLRNCIVWNDTAAEILAWFQSAAYVTYSTVSNGWPGTGNLNLDPRFAASGVWVTGDDGVSFFFEGDYHLMSQAGRWDPVTETWVADAFRSPAIDAGDEDAWSAEPAPNGARINQGAYGGTSQASMSP